MFYSTRKLKAQIESYSKKLGSSVSVNLEDVAECHSVKLVLEKEPEKRLRSIQTLAQMRHRSGVGPAFNDLLLACKKWPRKNSQELSLILLSTLKEYWEEPAP
jgi:hypothetical protein